MGWVIALLLIAIAAYFIIRMGAMALEMTGISRDTARFQALSAFFGVGFTTTESELVVNRPVRRRIIRDLIVVGNLGILSIIASAVASIVAAHPSEVPGQLGIIVGVLALLFLSGRVPFVIRIVDWVVRTTLERSGAVRALDYEKLLRIRQGFSVSEIAVEANGWLDGRRLAELRARDEGLNVIAIVNPDGQYQGMPRGTTELQAGQTLIVYGPDAAIQSLATRPGGEEGRLAHEESVRDFKDSEANDTTKQDAPRD